MQAFCKPTVDNLYPHCKPCYYAKNEKRHYAEGPPGGQHASKQDYEEGRPEEEEDVRACGTILHVALSFFCGFTA